jgi:hypothetical protein
MDAAQPLLRIAEPGKKMPHGIQPQFDFEKLELVEKLLRLLVVHGPAQKKSYGVRSGADDDPPIVLRLPRMSTAGRVPPAAAAPAASSFVAKRFLLSICPALLYIVRKRGMESLGTARNKGIPPLCFGRIQKKEESDEHVAMGRLAGAALLEKGPDRPLDFFGRRSSPPASVRFWPALAVLKAHPFFNVHHAHLSCIF